MIDFALATREDDPGIRRLLATNPMPGRIRVRFEREPDYFAGCGDDTQVLVARDGARIVGVACRTIRKLYVNGVPEDIGYLGQLRVDRNYRGMLLTARGYRVMRDLHGDGRARGTITTIVSGNREAEGVLVRRTRGVMPRYRFLERLYTLAIACRGARERRSFGVFAPQDDSANEREKPVMLTRGGDEKQKPVLLSPAEGEGPSLDPSGSRYNLFPAYEPQGEVVRVQGASAALVDQRAYKQTVVDGYAPALRLARPLYNLVGRIKLPRPGTALNHAYATHFLAEDEDSAGALIEALRERAAEKGLDHILLGFTESDPLLPVARRFHPVEYQSSIYTVAFDDGDDLHDRLDSRPRALDLSAL